MLSAVVQLFYLVDIRDDPTFTVPVIDAAVYRRQAEAFARGEGLEPGAPFWQPPLLPLILGCAFVVTGIHDATMRFMLAGLACTACVLTWALGRRLFSNRIGIVSGLVLTLYGPFLFFSQHLLPASLGIVLTLVAMLTLCTCVTGRHGLWMWAVHGVAVGLATINIPTAAVLLIAAGWAALSTSKPVHGPDSDITGGQADPSASHLVSYSLRHWITGVIRGMAMLVGFAPPVLAVAVRNAYEGGAWVWVSTNGGINLYLGNNPDWQNTVAIRPGPDWERLVREPLAAGQSSTQAQSAYFARKVWRFLLEQPGAFAWGMGLKGWHFVHSREIPRNVDLYASREWSIMLRLLCWRIGSFSFPWGVIGPLAVTGAMMSVTFRHHGRRRRQRVYVLVAALCYALGVILIFPTARYRMPIVPVAVIFAVGALLSIAGCAKFRFAGRRETAHRLSMRHSRVASLAVGALAAVVINFPLSTPLDRIDFTADLFYQVAGEHLSAGRIAQADALLRQTLARQPRHAPSVQSLARLRMSQGRLGEAEALIDGLAAQVPPDAPPRFRSSLLSVLYADLARERGDMDKAEAYYRDGLLADPTDPEALLALGLLARRRDDTRAAEDFLRRASQMGLRTGQADILLGDILTERGDYEEAIRAYRRGLWLAQPRPDVLARVARLLATCPVVELREPAQAVKLAEAAVALRGDDAELLDTLGVSLHAAGRHQEAIQVWRRAMTLARQTGNRMSAETVEARLDALGWSDVPDAPSAPEP